MSEFEAQVEAVLVALLYGEIEIDQARERIVELAEEAYA